MFLIENIPSFLWLITSDEPCLSCSASFKVHVRECSAQRFTSFPLEKQQEREREPFTLAKGKTSPLRHWFCFDSHWMILIYLSPGAGLAPLWASPLPCGEGCSLVWPTDHKMSHGARASDESSRRTSRHFALFLFTALELKKFSSPDTMFPTSFTCLFFFFFCNNSKNMTQFLH